MASPRLDAVRSMVTVIGFMAVFAIIVYFLMQAPQDPIKGLIGIGIILGTLLFLFRYRRSTASTPH